MASTATMKGLWGLIESMSLSVRNKKWLTAKLIESTSVGKKPRSKEDMEILDGFRGAILELKEIKAGRKHAVPHDEALAELRKELEAEGWDEIHKAAIKLSEKPMF